MKSLEQLRDELAESYGNRILNTLETADQRVRSFKQGFNAAVQAIHEREKNARVFEIKDRTFILKLDPQSLRWLVIENINTVYDKELHSHATLGEALHALSMCVLDVEKEGRKNGQKEIIKEV